MCAVSVRSFVLNNGLYKQYQIARHNDFVNRSIQYLQALEVEWSINYGPLWFDYIEECKRIGNSSYQRCKRLKKRITDILQECNSLFLTLTFNDDVLSNTTQDFRRKLVKEFLDGYSSPYVANIDFGGANGREHYHAVIGCCSVDYTKWHCFGAVKGEKVQKRTTTAVKLSRYIDKLALHAIKDSTSNTHNLLYSHRLPQRISLL